MNPILLNIQLCNSTHNFSILFSKSKVNIEVLKLCRQSGIKVISGPKKSVKEPKIILR